MSFSHGSATEPAMSATGDDKQRLHLDPAEFRQELKQLTEEVKALVRVARKVGKNNKVLIKGGEEVGPKQLNAMVADHNRRVKNLAKNYVARGRRKRGAGVPKRQNAGAGFNNPVYLRPELVNFLRTANFGTAANGQQISELLSSFLDSGILSRSTLTPLLVIYAFRNGLRNVEQGVDKNGKPKKRIFFSAGPAMQSTLGPWLAQLEAADKAKTTAQLTDAKGNVKPRFDRNRFLYSRLQSIVNPGIVPKDQLTAPQQTILENPEVKGALAQLQTILTATREQVNPGGKK